MLWARESSYPFMPMLRPPDVAAERPRMTPSEPTSRSDSTGNEQTREQAALLAAMANGDKNALASLYDSLSRPLYSLAYRITNDSSEAQDIVQDVFLQLWRKASSYDTSRGSVFSWAATLTRNRSIDRIRMRKRHAELLAESAHDLQPASSNSGDNSAETLWVREKADAVRAALMQLAPDQKKAIELAFFNGLTQQEIAAKLDEPLGTIKARIRRGLLKLRESLPARL
ncbi:sigma-70 family RNA polymerase sigma factor [Oleiharenicola lentus]|uniref:sigma-70 family RNA polymerase sigma factor n=1 Tax=Oleiharenicola lentus TaxID=2508720 RepID=UPI003F66CD27